MVLRAEPLLIRRRQVVLKCVKVDGWWLVDVKCHLRNLQKSCSTGRCKAPESVSVPVGLNVKLVDDALVTSSPRAGSLVDPHIDKSTGQMASTRAEEILATAKLSDLNKALDTLRRVHVNLVRRYDQRQRRRWFVL